MELTLVLTHACNLGCTYCYAGAKDARAMPAAVMERALGWALASCRGRLRLGWFGGEPLLRWDLLTAWQERAERLAAAQGVALEATLTTNATLLDAGRMDWLAAHAVTVGVSIDGTRAAHELMRPRAGGGGSYDAVRAGLAAALARVPMTPVISVVHPATVHLLAAGVDELLAAGARVQTLSLDPSAAWDLDTLETCRVQLGLVAARVADELRAGHDLWIDPVDGHIAGRVKGGAEACDRCDAGGGELAVAPSGAWYPCERMVGEDGPAARRWALGDVFARADGGPDPERVRALAAAHAAEPAACRACPLRERCQHACACSNVMASGAPAEPGGAQCAFQQAAIAAADGAAAALWAEADPLFLRRRYRLTA